MPKLANKLSDKRFVDKGFRRCNWCGTNAVCYVAPFSPSITQLESRFEYGKLRSKIGVNLILSIFDKWSKEFEAFYTKDLKYQDVEVSAYICQDCAKQIAKFK